MIFYMLWVQKNEINMREKSWCIELNQVSWEWSAPFTLKKLMTKICGGQMWSSGIWFIECECKSGLKKIHKKIYVNKNE